jgi:hypothetical protein
MVQGRDRGTTLAGGNQVTVDTVALSDTATAVRGVIRAQRGRRLTELAAQAAVFGEQGVQDAFDQFCSRWSDGLDVLTADAAAISDTLDAVVAAYRLTDELNADRYRPGTVAR